MQPYPPMGQMPGQPPGPGMMPGQPGYPYAYQPPPPSAPRTLGTLSIIFGAVVAAMGAFGLVSAGSGMMSSMMGKLPAGGAAFEDYMHAIRTPSMVQSLVLIAMSLWLVFIGVGQRGYRAWAARQSVAWGVIALIVVVGLALIALAVTGPAAARMMDEIQELQGRSNPIQGMGSMMGMFSLIGVVFYAPYPIILLVTFRKPAIIAAMTA